MSVSPDRAFGTDLPPPPKEPSFWKNRSVLLGSLVGVVVLAMMGGSFFKADLNKKLSELLPVEIETTFGQEGIVVSVESVSCENLPDRNAVFTVSCAIRVSEMIDSFETIVQGNVDGDEVNVDEVFSRERLVTREQVMAYVQRLVDDIDPSGKVLDCDLGGPIAVIRQGHVFDCALEVGGTVSVTVAANGSGRITAYPSIEGTYSGNLTNGVGGELP